MTQNGKYSKFLATSNGLCATRWLSFALAVRPDVFVAHGKYPLDSITCSTVNNEKNLGNKNSLAFGNVLDFFYSENDIDSVFNAYEAVMPEAESIGCVHTYTLRQVDSMVQSKDIQSDFHIINIIRHPITYINSHVSMVNKSKKNPYLYDGYRRGLFLNVLDRYPSLVSASEADPDDVFSFIVSCFSLKQMAEDLRLDYEHMKMEALTTDLSQLHYFCTRLTGLEYNSGELNNMIEFGPVNRHRSNGQSNSPEKIYSDWNDWQKTLFEDIITDDLRSAFAENGYDLSMVEHKSARISQGKKVAVSAKPTVIKANKADAAPRISLILLDWSCRERFHSLDWLNRQTVSREQYEIIWVELFDRKIPEVLEKADVVINCSQSGLYHKHKGYNAGLLAAKGDIITVCDSDAIFANYFIESILSQFYNNSTNCRSMVLFHHEQRTPAGHFYRDGIENIYPQGLSEPAEMLKYSPWLDIWPNVGACMSVKKSDAFFFGGFDESESYRGLVCGPYDLGWRMVNAGIPEIWEERIALFHFAHPNSDQNMDSEGKNQIIYPQVEGHALTAVEAFCSGRVQPLQENPEIYKERLSMRCIGTNFEKQYATKEAFTSPVNYDETSLEIDELCDRVLDKSFRKLDEIFFSFRCEPTIHKKNEISGAKLSIILLDWSCRERFQALEWLSKQTVSRSEYQIVWVELFDRVAPEAMDKADVVITCNQEGIYHKHKGYNAGVLHSSGDIITICDSDAVFPENFVESVLSSFGAGADPDGLTSKVLMHYEYRTHSQYPDNLVSTDQLADYDWQPLWPNVGACVSFLYNDIIRLGGFDECRDYTGYICGPYDLGWRMTNAGIPEEWHNEEIALWHFAHPHSNQSENTDEWNEITTEHFDWHAKQAVKAFSQGKILPEKENYHIWKLRMDYRTIGTEFEERYTAFPEMSPFLTDCLIDLIDADQCRQVFNILERILIHVNTPSELGLWLWKSLTTLGNEMAEKSRYRELGLKMIEKAASFGEHIKADFNLHDISKISKNNSHVIYILHYLFISGFFKGNIEKLFNIVMDLVKEVDESDQNLKHLSELLVLIGKGLKEKGLTVLCEKALLTANRLDPLNPATYLELSHLMIESGDADRALAFSERGVQVNPSNPDLIMVRIKALEMKNDYAAAIRYIEFYWSMYSENKVSKLKTSHHRMTSEHERLMVLHGREISQIL